MCYWSASRAEGNLQYEVQANAIERRARDLACIEGDEAQRLRKVLSSLQFICETVNFLKLRHGA